jgi:hypothetical protein
MIACMDTDKTREVSELAVDRDNRISGSSNRMMTMMTVTMTKRQAMTAGKVQNS